MSTLLDWRPAHPEDLRDRRRFVCTRPERATWDGRRTRTHPAPWELDVQSWIRSTTLSSDEAMLLGSDSHALAAVVAWAEIGGLSSILLQALAVAAHHRGSGGEIAQEAVAVALGEVRVRAERVGSTSIVVETRIDRRNRPSRRLAGAVGFIQDVEIGPDLERWLYVEDLSPSTSPCSLSGLLGQR